jgi:GNAT superfamily N-acetyltransferase
MNKSRHECRKELGHLRVDSKLNPWQYLTVVNYLAPVALRTMRADDLPWVTARARHVLDGMGEMDPRAMVTALRRVAIDPGATAMVAHPDGAGSELLGWGISWQGGIVGVYVHPPWRGAGIGRALIASVVSSPIATIPCAFWSMIASQMAAKGFPLRYDLELRNQVKRMAR